MNFFVIIKIFNFFVILKFFRFLFFEVQFVIILSGGRWRLAVGWWRNYISFCDKNIKDDVFIYFIFSYYLIILFKNRNFSLLKSEKFRCFIIIIYCLNILLSWCKLLICMNQFLRSMMFLIFFILVIFTLQILYQKHASSWWF